MQIPENRINLLEQFDAGDYRIACLTFVQETRKNIKEQYHQGVIAEELLRRLSNEFDQLLAVLFQHARISSDTVVSLIALGGYGRGELFPYSDLDLLLLYEGGDDSVTRQILERVMYPLWDAKVAVNYSVRSLDETLLLATEDLTVCTSLLDARLLAGHEGPFHALSAAALRQFYGPAAQQFLKLLKEERSTRHKRFGETVYLLEPNIKLGKGGLRDLNTGLWAIKARYGLSAFDALPTVGGATPRQVRNLIEAQTFLRSLRLAMHLEANRSQDHLLFDLQEKLAPRFFIEEPIVFGRKNKAPTVEPAVERLMHRYYRYARAIVLETERILERCDPDSTVRALADSSPKLTNHPKEHFIHAGDRIHSLSSARFWEEPAEIVRAFQLSMLHRLPLSTQTRDALAEAAAAEPGEQLVADAMTAKLFLEILCHSESSAEGSVLEVMHDLGIIAAIIPEFDPCTGRIQHDLYHVYTVDLHSLYVVILLKSWQRGEQSEQYPTAVSLMASLVSREGLFLAALLHDVGKPLGHGHAIKGSRMAVGVAARLGLDPNQQSEVQFLVEQHLIMAHLSQRRDLSDPTVIKTLADQVGTVDRLRKLYLLTLADTAMTAPENLTDWKVSLMDELYIHTYLYLSHDEGVFAEERERYLRDQRDALEIALRREMEETAWTMARRLPREIFFAYPQPELLHHVRVALAFESNVSTARRVEVRPRNHTVFEVTICCWDSPGRLATITGIMLAHRIEVLSAQVYTIQPVEKNSSPNCPATVLDIFTVRLPNEEDTCNWDKFSTDLELALLGNLSVPDLVSRYTQPSRLPPRVVPRVEIVIAVDNDISDRFTVLDVQAPDRLGVLYAITRTLNEQGLIIQLSKVTTEAGRVVDIFYVSDRISGGKILDEERLLAIKTAIVQAINALGQASA